jgi:hypothetical protein
MGVQSVQKDAAIQLAVRLLDSGDDPVVGVAFGDVTAQYKKQGDSSWTSKTVLTTDWTEVSDGRYLLLFSGTQLDTAGKFVFRVDATGAETFTGDVDVVEDWDTLVDMLTDLLNGLSAKVAVEDIKTSKRQQDETIEAVNETLSSIEDQVKVLEAKFQALYRKVNP